MRDDWTITRRGAVAGAAAMGLLLPRAASAQIAGAEIMAPAGTGGGYDQLARAVQQVLESEGLASAVQVVNVPGAGGTVGLAQLVTGKKRGINLMVTGLGMIGAIRTNKAPVSLDQTTPIARLTGEYQPLVVAASSPIRTTADLVAKLKADPGSVSWGGFALGSPDHLLCAMVVKSAGVEVAKMNYIVAGAGGEMLSQVIGGHLTVATGGLNEFAQQIEAGRLRALGISSAERLPGIDLPTFREQGVDAVLVNWRGLVAAASTRPADVERLDDALARMVKSEAWQSLLRQRGWVDMHQGSAGFAAFLREEKPRIEGLLGDLGLSRA